MELESGSRVNDTVYESVKGYKHLAPGDTVRVSRMLGGMIYSERKKFRVKFRETANANFRTLLMKKYSEVSEGNGSFLPSPAVKTRNYSPCNRYQHLLEVDNGERCTYLLNTFTLFVT